MSEAPNVFAEGSWDFTAEKMGVRGNFVAKRAGAHELGGTVYEYEPGATGFNLHTHYGIEELFVVLQGHPTLRTPDAERPLEPGDVIACPRGRDGMHTFSNQSDGPARILALSTVQFPDVAVYPELGTVGVVTRHPFEPVPEGGDEGVIGRFDLSANKRT
jgi:uncharacterized cupin superfamily protein